MPYIDNRYRTYYIQVNNLRYKLLYSEMSFCDRLMSRQQKFIGRKQINPKAKQTRQGRRY